ncbi:hypothetical protein LJ753_13995 [Arthrobacter sp. zg-Y20]|uniref:hypothetical protein n=1 Tax=unclassified Arthrobacter TaxID=235627 RepID=UPI001D15A5B5|nr:MULTISPECIES: hypothetical protein [unclassified Arthrobacter]MCC3276979.1 hypothetical protein [Arthrobacter sp. zg-Y20]MDK1317140.1 hypothetical protein [Arthrobacter sp. zg.Y20]WIB07238.1 hypothetical protein QNO06_05805 [Arthrobacter sp. zg-Y20]
MWSSSGKKLTGSYGTWKEHEVEIDSTTLDDRVFLLIKHGGDAPGPGWLSVEDRGRFPTPGVVIHSLEVPAEDVTGIHCVRAMGNLGLGREVKLLAEDPEGNYAAISGESLPPEERRRLVSAYGFTTFYDEPVERSSVFGWLPAEKVHNIRSEVSWRKDDDS